MGHILHHQGLAFDEEMIHGEKLEDSARAGQHEHPRSRDDADA
jgi:hypothetical protein